MTDEYISRAKARADFEACNAENPNWTPQRVKTLLLRQPAADVAPVRHGQWGDNGIPGSVLRGCSVCGFTCGSSSFFYCPSCGTRMDGGDTDGGKRYAEHRCLQKKG